MIKLKTAFLLIAATLGLGLATTSHAQAKVLKYRTTSSNAFSYTKYHQAFMYGGREGKSTLLFKTKFAANADFDNFYTKYTKTQQNQILDAYGPVFNDGLAHKVFYARKVKGYPKLMQLKIGKKTWYTFLLDAKFYRYNTWRSGHKIKSLLPPTDKKHIMLKAKTHVYSSQPWVENWAFKQNPGYTWYRYNGHSWYKFDK